MVSAKRIEASRNEMVQTQPALKEEGHMCHIWIFRKVAFKRGQDCPPTNNAIIKYVNQKLYLHVCLVIYM